jgi:hypothetical protein
MAFRPTIALIQAGALSKVDGRVTDGVTVSNGVPILPKQAWVTAMERFNASVITNDGNAFDWSNLEITFAGIECAAFLFALGVIDAGGNGVNLEGNLISSVDALLSESYSLPRSLNLSGGTNAVPTPVQVDSDAAASVSISGAGLEAVNEDSPRSADENGRAAYSVSNTDEGVLWDGTKWVINHSAVAIYQSTDDVEYPWLVETWIPADNVNLPSPVVARVSGFLPNAAITTRLDNGYPTTVNEYVNRMDDTDGIEVIVYS